MIIKPTYEELEQQIRDYKGIESKQNQTIDSLQNKLQKYEHIVSMTSEHISFIDRNYVYQAVNSAYLRAHQKLSQDILGHSVKDLLGADIFESFVKEKLDRCLTGEEIHYQEWFNFSDSDRRYMDVGYFPHIEANREITGLVISSRDITEFKQAEDTLQKSNKKLECRVNEHIVELKSLNDMLSDSEAQFKKMIKTFFLIIMNDVTERKQMEGQLQQSQKLEAIGVLAGGIAHDFNNVLFPIVGLSEMLMDKIHNEQIKKDMEIILKAGKRATDLVSQILTFSRQHQHQLQPLLLQPILKEIIKLSRATIPTIITIEQDIDTTCGPVLADAVQIHQVIMNLITNAFHAMEKSGGVLSISFKEKIETEADPALWQTGQQRYVCINIQDNGVGMDKKTLENIFQPYFTTKTQNKGSGLGLAVSHGIIASLGGKIIVKSKVGKGSCFSVYLPTTPKKIRTEFLPEYTNTHGNQEKILIIDDDESIITVLQLMLSKLGFQVEAYHDSTKAFDAFKKNPGDYDLVISDLTMPNMTGDKLCSEIKKINPQTPVIIFTGYKKINVLDETQGSGIDRVLTKPIIQSHLLSAINELIEKE